jgi:hypothetical protein
MKKNTICLIISLLISANVLFSQQNTYLVSLYDSVFSCNTEYVFLNAQHIFNYDSAIVTPVTGSLIAEDHTAEGFMVTLASGAIVHFFRIDPGINGDHIGNNARIVKRTTYNNGLNWSPLEEVFNDSMFDDRNVHGGLMGQDSIVLFFRRYNAYFQTQVDLNYIYSLDGGLTWSPRIVINSISNGTFGSNKLFKVPGRGWLMSIAGQYYVEIRISYDGITWNDNVAYIWNYTYSMEHYIAEACFTYLGNGKLIGLFRNNNMNYGASYYQVTSSDLGYSWTEPDSTNIALPYWCVSPQIFYDPPHKDLWVIATDRRNYSGGFPASLSSVWIYKNSVDDVFNNTMGYTLFKNEQRPVPNWYRFYGYTCYTRKADGNYFAIFSESYKKPNFKEDADFYQFNINYMPVQHQSTNYIWNTGATSHILQADTTGIYNVISFDSCGHSHTDSVFVSIMQNTIFCNTPVINQGEGIMLSADTSLNQVGYSFFWSTGSTTPSIWLHPDSTITVYLTVSNGYFDCTDSVTVTVLPLITNIEQQKITGLEIFPNPFIDYAEIVFPNQGKDRFSLSLFNMSGQLIRKDDNITSDHYILSKGNLAPGIYLLKLTSAQKEYTARIVAD